MIVDGGGARGLGGGASAFGYGAAAAVLFVPRRVAAAVHGGGSPDVVLGHDPLDLPPNHVLDLGVAEAVENGQEDALEERIRGRKQVETFVAKM